MAVNLLLSYAFHADTDLAKVRANLVCGRLMVDSGAFTAWTKGRPIAVDDYARYLETFRGCWDHAVTLDVIGDPAASQANTRKLHERGLPVMPVFTRGNTLADFDAMVAEVGYVCVGGLVGLPAKAQAARAKMLQRRARDAGGGIHALGIGSMATLRAARPYSADASSVSAAFRFGTIVYFDGRELRNISVTDRARLIRDHRHIRAHGIDLAFIAREGKLPSKKARGRLMTAMSLAYACADEVLKASGPVPAPHSGAASGGVGTHLFGSLGKGDGGTVARQSGPDTLAGLDRDLHAGTHLYNSAGWAYAGPGPVSALDRQLHEGTHLFSSLARFDGASVTRTAGLDSDLHDPGTHLYNIAGYEGGNTSPELITGLDQELHPDPGPHLYSSVTPEWGPPLVAETDRQAHGPEVPLAWRWYGRTHTCRKGADDLA